MSNGIGDGLTARTYTDEQIDEQARDLVMTSSRALVAAIGGGAAMNPERVSALADAVVAGTHMMELPMRPETEPE